MVKEGDKVLINGKEYTLGARLGGGLEGSIFEVEGFPRHVIKVINDEVKIGNSKYSIIACSVMGQGKLENQDSYDYYFDDNQIIITVADGLGSATFSKEGSSKIVKLLIDILKENIDKESIPLELLNRWKTALGGNLNLYDTTIKFIHIKEDSINYGGVGDGWIAINEKENFISLCASNTFSNQTDSILSFDLRNKFINRENEVEAVKNMLISTDGFSEDIEKENGKSFMTTNK